MSAAEGAPCWGPLAKSEDKVGPPVTEEYERDSELVESTPKSRDMDIPVDVEIPADIETPVGVEDPVRVEISVDVDTPVGIDIPVDFEPSVGIDITVDLEPSEASLENFSALDCAIDALLPPDGIT